MEINTAKMELRARMRAAYDDDARTKSSAMICEKLRALPEWQAAKMVMAYAPMGDEPDIEPLLCKTRATALPRWADDGYEPAKITNLTGDIYPGRFGVREPASGCPSLDWSEIDMMLIPGLAFDTEGNRLGRGGGFYDRLLENARKAGEVTSVGIAFDWQLVKSVPLERHDLPVTLVLSPSGYFR